MFTQNDLAVLSTLLKFIRIIRCKLDLKVKKGTFNENADSEQSSKVFNSRHYSHH